MERLADISVFEGLQNQANAAMGLSSMGAFDPVEERAAQLSVINLGVSYASDVQEAQCTEGTELNAALVAKNPLNAQKIKERLASLKRADVVEELRNAPGRFHSLVGDRQGQVSCILTDGDRLVFEPDHSPVPVDENGNVDWAKVTDVKIVFVGDYHRKKGANT